MTSQNNKYAGLFGVLGEGACIEGVNMVNVRLTGANEYVGAIAGKNAGTIRNCSVVSGTIKGSVAVGGIVGENNGQICEFTVGDETSNLTIEKLSHKGTNYGAGGVAGINFECSFLKEGSSRATYEQIIQHLLHMKNVAGIETIGFGSDFDGIDDNGELVNYGGFSTLLQMMEKHFTYDEMDKITHLNALRVMKDVLGK
jgi:hypothetical protein